MHLKKVSLILLSIISLYLLSACNNDKIKIVTDEISEPIIVITDTDKSSKSEDNTFWLDSGSKHIYFKEIFWSSDIEDGPFYKKQIDSNDVDSKQVLKEKKTDTAPLPKHYKISMVTDLKHPTPAYILGKINSADGKEITWKQEYKEPDSNSDYLIELPSFKDSTATISLRFIWMNENQECYGVADKVFNIKKI